jgi:lysophospholipase L1-like esterase
MKKIILAIILTFIFPNNILAYENWLTLGDSITKAGVYQDILKNNFKNIDNLGLNGQTMAYQDTNTSTYYVGKNIDYKKYDLVSIFIGTNDFRYHKPLGEINNFDEKTFAGAYQLLIEQIKKDNPNATILLITPLQRVKDGFDIRMFNKTNHKLIDYVNVVKDLANLYNLPMIDLYSQSNITTENIYNFTTDGLHPNNLGYEVIAKHIEDFLR